MTFSKGDTIRMVGPVPYHPLDICPIGTKFNIVDSTVSDLWIIQSIDGKTKATVTHHTLVTFFERTTQSIHVPKSLEKWLQQTRLSHG